jgi:hypothetical protein
MKKLSILLFCIGNLNTFLFAQQDSVSEKTKTYGKVKFIPLPVIGANPTSGFMIGLAPGATWFMGDPKNTSLSSALGTLIYTSKKQWIITLKATTFLKGDKWNLLTDIRYFITSQPTYGLGTGPQSGKPLANGFADYSNNPYNPVSSAQMMAFNYLRFYQTVMRRYKDSRFFGGLGYHMDYHYNIDDKMLDLTSSPQTLTSHYVYNTSKGISTTEYVLSGISLNALYDSRDNAVNPYKGRYAFVNLHINPTFLGSSKSSTMLWLEYRDYLHLSKERPRHLIGLWTYGWFVTSGKVPYMDLPALGWDQFGRSGRAYTQGRFRGEDVIYSELEYRVPLQREKETFGAVFFVNGVTASNRSGNINLGEYINFGYGAGLRVMIDKKARTNLNIDYAFGNYGAQGFYLGLNEVF